MSRSCARRSRSASVVLGQRHAVARKLLQRLARQISARHTHAAGGRKADAADAHHRSAAGTPKGKESRDSVGKIIASHCRSFGKTRADNFVSEPARIFHVAALQQLRRSAQLSELQRCAHVSSPSGSRGTVELSFVRAYRRGPEEMSGVRPRRADLLRLRHRESGINSRANFSKSCRVSDGRRLHDAQGRVSRNFTKFSHWQDRHPRRHADDRERSALSKCDARRNHQRRSCVASARFPRRRTHVSASHAGRRTRWARRNAGRSFRANLHAVFSPSIQFARHHDFAGYFQQELEFRERCDFPPFKHAILITVRSAHEGRAKLSAETLKRRLKEALPEEFILGDATPAPLEKLQGQFRFHILIRGEAEEFRA